MKIKFLSFFSLVACVGILSLLNSWLIQQQVHGEINFMRAIFQVALIILVLYLLWGRSNPGYVLAVIYVIANAVLYGYELFQYFILGNVEAKLSVSATLISGLIIFSAVAALILFAMDYIDYRKRSVDASPTL